MFAGSEFDSEQAAAAALQGYDQQCWDTGVSAGVTCPPLSDAQFWNDMTDDARTGYEEFCWTQTIWDSWPGLW